MLKLSIFFMLLTFLTNLTQAAQPELEVHALFLGQSSSSQTLYPNGFNIHEIEFNYSGNLDDNWSGSLLMAIEPEFDPTTNVTTFSLEPEEVYFENKSFQNFDIRLGQQRIYFGQLNHKHAHALPFIDMPLTTSEVFGEDGMSESGLAVTYSSPSPWNMEIKGQIINANNERAFASSTNGDPAGILYLKNKWELKDSSQMEWLLSYGSGKNKGNKSSSLYNSALTYQNSDLLLTAEHSQLQLNSFIDSNDVLFEDLKNIQATSLWGKYQFNEKQFLQLRIETAKTYLQDDFAQQLDLNKRTLLFGYSSNANSIIRLQLDEIDFGSGSDLEQRIGLLFNFSMGSSHNHEH